MEKLNKQRKWMDRATAADSNRPWRRQLVCGRETGGGGGGWRNRTVIICFHAHWPKTVFVICSLWASGTFMMRLWENGLQQWNRTINRVVYRNRVEISAMFSLLFIFPSLTAAVHRLGGGVFPHAHPCVFNVVVVLLLLLYLCAASVSLWC